LRAAGIARIEAWTAVPYAASMASQRLSRPEFHSWAAVQPRGRYEGVAGLPTLDRVIRACGLSCQAAPGGMTVAIDDDTDYVPDALVNCGEPIPDDPTAVSDPLRSKIIRHARAGDRIEARIVRSGAADLDPLGIRLSLDEIYGD
jgi:hypothetical protein